MTTPRSEAETPRDLPAVTIEDDDIEGTGVHPGVYTSEFWGVAILAAGAMVAMVSSLMEPTISLGRAAVTTAALLSAGICGAAYAFGRAYLKSHGEGQTQRERLHLFERSNERMLERIYAEASERARVEANLRALSKDPGGR